MKMLDSKGDSSSSGDNQGYNPQGSYNQPEQPQYNEWSLLMKLWWYESS